MSETKILVYSKTEAKLNESLLAKVIIDSMKRNNYSRAELIMRIGYKNVNKGLRKLDKLMSHGDYKKDFFTKCIDALGVDSKEIINAVHFDEVTKAEKREKQEREDVEPYIYFKTERTIPSSITIFGLTGGTRRHKMLFIRDYFESTYMNIKTEEIKNIIKNHHKESKGIAPFFGYITSYLYCPTYDESYDCSVDGIIGNENLGHFCLPVASIRIG